MRKSTTLKIFFFFAMFSVFVFNFQAFAGVFKVEEGESQYVTRFVTAKNVKALEVRLATTINADSCNHFTMTSKPVLVEGDGSGWYDKYFFDAGITQTKMNCPDNKWVSKRISSAPILIKPFKNENVNNEIRVLFIIPVKYELDIREIK